MPEPNKPAVVLSSPLDPVYLLSPENYREPSYLHDKFIPVTGAVIGFVGTLFHNWSYRRPTFAGLPLIIGGTVAGTACGLFMQKRNEAYFAERDAVYRHYISLHPEDFPAKERILVGDMMKPWIPIR